MTHLQAHCPFCGYEGPLSPSDVLLLSQDDSPRTRVRFRCMACDHRVSVVVNHRIASILEANGARRVAEGYPAHEMREAPRPDPPFTYDDLLDLHLLLEQPDWFERFLESGSQG